MTLSFLDPSPRAGAGTHVPVARSPMEAVAVAAGARLERRDGWNVAASFDGPDHSAVVGFADVSHLRKVELQGDLGGTMGAAIREDGAWTCPLTPTKRLVIGGDPDPAGVDLTGAFCALTIIGPQARETIARFCALDLRRDVMPVAGLRPGSVARTPGLVLREEEDRFLLLVGSAYGEYLWTVVADAAGHLGGGPIGVDSLPDLPEALPGA
ncbi:MAG: sarcosine oxidase, subunit gamma [Solirubrobacteraceae bacterium]|jgi:glycine cleavage system aminomethyltransferase T|nr:sarcosine oxidase, subunit gamma [Solirubrobacteraceae bacterium]